ncbi:MAG: hypothetical protein AAGF11_32635 [Myxococcota bacterium]
MEWKSVAAALVVLAGCEVDVGDLGADPASTCALSAQTDLAWSLERSVSWGGPMGVSGHAVAVRDDGVLVAGSFAGTIDLDPGPQEQTAIGTPQGDPIGSGTYVSKLGLDGQLVWSAAFGGTRAAGADVRLSSGPQGEIYLAGRFSRPVDFDPGEGQQLRDPGEGYAGFVVRLEPDGRYGWVRTWERMVSHGGVPWVFVDTVGGLWVVHEHEAERLDPGTGGSQAALTFDDGGEILAAALREDDVLVVARDAVYSTESTTDPVVEAYDLAGTLVWSYALATPELSAITTVGSDTIVAGGFYDAGESGFAIDAAGYDVHTGHGHRDAFATRLDADGQRRFTVTWGGLGHDRVDAVIPGPDSTVFVAGSFYQTLHRTDRREAFDARDQDAYVMHLDPQGQTLGVRSWGGRGEDEALGVDWAAGQGLWVIGSFDDELDAAAEREPVVHRSQGHSDALLLGLLPGELEDGGSCSVEPVDLCGEQTSSRLSGTDLPPHFDACMRRTGSSSFAQSNGERMCIFVVEADADPPLFEQCRVAGGGLVELEPGQACKINYDECDGPCFGNSCD